MRILFFGLPGTGKTTLADEVAKQLRAGGWLKRLLQGPVVRLNADAIRHQYNDWDFSANGRFRQAQRMRQLADDWFARETSPAPFVIADFVAPLPEYRRAYDADFAIYMDTLQEGRFEDTNKLWVPPTPEEYHHHITTHRDVTEEAAEVCRLIAARQQA